MIKLDLNQTIGESVTINPELVRVYMDYGVDFCCGGDRTVKEAIERDTDEVEKLIAEAEKAMEQASQFSVGSSSMKLSDFSTDQLIDRIVSQHHSYLKKELPVISELMFTILTEFSKKSTTSTGGSDAKHHEDELLFFYFLRKWQKSNKYCILKKNKRS